MAVHVSQFERMKLHADAMGINTTYYKVLAFAIGAFFAGVAGALYAHNFYIIQPVKLWIFKIN